MYILPVRFTTPLAFVDDIPTAVAEAYTSPITLIVLADVEDIAATPPAVTVPVMVFVADEVKIAEPTLPPNTFPFTVNDVPEKFIPYVVELVNEPITSPFTIKVPDV